MASKKLKDFIGIQGFVRNSSEFLFMMSMIMRNSLRVP